MIPLPVRAEVWRRAGHSCEYCRLPQRYSPLRHHIEHIVARQHGGSSDSSNLALACQRCNLKKGPNLTGIDPYTGELVALFHPRTALWSEHFCLQEGRIDGISPVGRATVAVLELNDPRRVELRQEIPPDELLLPTPD